MTRNPERKGHALPRVLGRRRAADVVGLYVRVFAGQHGLDTSTLLATLVKDMLSRCDRAKCRVFWRSYAPGPMLQQKNTDLFTVHSPALAQLPHREVQSYDRVGWYLSQVDGDDPQDADLDALCPAGSSKTYENSLMDDALVCLAMARQALRKDKDVAAFYRNQAGRYGGFRESLLPDRDAVSEVHGALVARAHVAKEAADLRVSLRRLRHGARRRIRRGPPQVAAAECKGRALRPVARAPRASEAARGQARPRGPRRPHPVRHHGRARGAAKLGLRSKTAPSWRAPTASR